MFTLCLLFTFGFVALFVFSPPLVAQINPFVYSDLTSTQSTPYYVIWSTQQNNWFFRLNAQSLGLHGTAFPEAAVSDLIRAIMVNNSCDVVPLSDFSDNMYFPSLGNGSWQEWNRFSTDNCFLARIPSGDYTATPFSPALEPNTSRPDPSLCPYGLCFGLSGLLYTRKVLGKSDTFDIFYYFNTAAWDSSQNYYYTNPILFSNYKYSDGEGGSITLRPLFPGLHFMHTTANFTSNANKAFLFTGDFRVRVVNNKVSIIGKNQGIPYHVNGLYIEYCMNKNGYWDGDGSTSYPSYFPRRGGDGSLTRGQMLISSVPFANENPFDKTYQIKFVNGSVASIASQEGASPNLTTHDTDNGGMPDIYEWYQTEHDLLNPADDQTNTITPPKEDPPEPKPGEEVVDIGVDTVDLYGWYWDEKVGDASQLPDIAPSDVDEPTAFAPEQYDINSMYQEAASSVNSSIEGTQFKSRFDGVFAPLTNADQLLTWEIDPSINSDRKRASSVNVSLSLPTLTIDPQTVINHPTYGIYFRTFRAVLVIIQFIIVFYMMYRVVLDSLSGTNAPAGGSEE